MATAKKASKKRAKPRAPKSRNVANPDGMSATDFAAFLGGLKNADSAKVIATIDKDGTITGYVFSKP